jgi:hypothetical protein
VGQTIAFRGLSFFRKITMAYGHGLGDNLKKRKLSEDWPPDWRLIFMKIRGPKALGNRRRKAIVCPTLCFEVSAGAAADGP